MSHNASPKNGIAFCPLASGSKGNSILFSTPESKILIDAGLSGKATKERLAAIGVDIEEIDALIISHEHGDHIKGAKPLCLRYGIPVLSNSDTAKALVDNLDYQPKFHIFSTGESFHYRDLEIHPFSVPHDTLDPVMFTIKAGETKSAFCTDLGFVTSLVRQHLKNCDSIYIEANHEPSMVHACARPMSYKQRVLGRSGHLSNAACAQLINEVWHPGLHTITLAHLSEECNHPDVAAQTIVKVLADRMENVRLNVAPQHTPGAYLRVDLSSPVPQESNSSG